jgi:predicted RNA-binding protein with PUA-like domain
MRYWLMKTEPDVFSYADLERLGSSGWDGVRNYQARNHMRDMKLGDEVLIYHSSVTPPGVAGIAKVVEEAHTDESQFDPESDYFDAKSPRDNPRWQQVRLEPKNSLEFVPLEILRGDAKLEGMLILRTGNRLSVTPVEASHYRRILKLGGIK